MGTYGALVVRVVCAVLLYVVLGWVFGWFHLTGGIWNLVQIGGAVFVSEWLVVPRLKL